MKRIRADDEAAFRALFQATYDDLLCFVERRTHSGSADDVVAEVFLTAWRRFDDVPVPAEEARRWLFTVAHNMLRNSRRSDQRQSNLSLRLLQQPGGSPSGGAEADGVAVRVDLVRAWQELTPADQEALTLTVFEGLTGAQAAQVLGITRATFSVRLLRARRRLRKHLSAPAAVPTAIGVSA